MTAETHPIDKERVMAYLDGELAPDEAARVALHLDQCAGCAGLASELRGVSSRLLAWNVEPAPKRMSNAVLEARNKSGPKDEIGLGHGKPSTNIAWQKLMQSKWTWVTAGFVALCVVVLVTRTHLPSAIPQQLASREVASLAMERSLISNNLEKQDRGQSIDAASPAAKAEAPSSAPMIARTATVKISVKDFNAARASLDQIVRAHQGYVSSLSVSTEQGAPRSLNAKLAIPAAQYDVTLADLRALGRVGQEQQSSEEVTSQIVDLDARLKNARETEAQLAEILRARTGKVGDVLEVEKEMARVRGEIEVMEADQKQFHERVAFASIDLNLAEEYQAQLGDAPWSAARRIRNALVDGYHSAADGLLNVCVIILNIGPSLLIWVLIFFWPARWAWRRWQKSRAQSEAGA